MPKRASSKRRIPTKPRQAGSGNRGTPAKRPEGERLQKILADAGLGSRRACEELITAGRVEVDREMVVVLGTRVDPAKQEIRVDGEPLPKRNKVYYAVNKPPGVVTTHRDPAQRKRVVDLVPADPAAMIAVGRLDMNSEGLILVTNDGELANRLTHPRYGVSKVYRVQVVGRPQRETLAQICRGVHLAEGLAQAKSAKVKSHHKQSTVLELVLTEGRNREIRRMFAALGHKVIRLVRIAVGPIRLGELPTGSYRPLTRQEVAALRHAIKAG